MTEVKLGENYSRAKRNSNMQRMFKVIIRSNRPKVETEHIFNLYSKIAKIVV